MKECRKKWSQTWSSGTVLAREGGGGGGADCDQRATQTRSTASCAVAERKNSSSVVEIVASSQNSVVVEPLSCFLLVFGWRCLFFAGSFAFFGFGCLFCSRFCLKFCFCTLRWQFLWKGGGRFNFPLCRLAPHEGAGSPSHFRVRVSAYRDRLPSVRPAGICVRRDRPLLSSARNVFLPARTREYVL